MLIAAAISTESDAHVALDEIIDRAIADIAPRKPDLAFFTLTNNFEGQAAELLPIIRERTGAEAIFGCAGEGIIGPDQEVERRPGMSLWLAHLPGVRVRAFHIHPSDLELVESVADLERLVHATPADKPAFLMLADPFFTPYMNGMDRGRGLLDAFAEIFVGSPVVGGMASGAQGEGQAVLMLGEDVFSEGAVCVTLSGDINLHSVVSQGCRPVGKPFIITAAERNVVKMLGGKPALAVLNDIYHSASEEDRKLMDQRVFFGRAISEYRDSYGRGDFLVRNVMGGNPESQNIFIDDLARVGTTVQFHVRDAKSADEDLAQLLAHERPPPAGGLIFSCNGRGTRMFSDENHDVDAIRRELGDLPLAGLFCAGEIGPVGGHAFVHGHTASIALFRPRGAEAAS